MFKKQMMDFLDEKIRKQRDLKKVIIKSLNLNILKRNLAAIRNGDEEELKNVTNDIGELPNRNILVFGKTGTGKTYTITEACKETNLPYIIVNCAELTKEGYWGKSAKEAIKDLYLKNKDTFDKTEIEHGVVVLDEIDKIAGKDKVSGEEIQKELLKLIDGYDLNEKSTYESATVGINADFKTDNLLFVGIGAFSGLQENKNINKIGFNMTEEEEKVSVKPNIFSTEQLIQYGFMPEFVGRFNEHTYTEDLDKDDLRDILINKKDSVLNRYKSLFLAYDIELKIDDEVIEAVVTDAIKKGTGARSLDNSISEYLKDIEYYLDELFGEGISEYTISLNNYKEDDIIKILNIKNEYLIKFKEGVDYDELD